VKNLFELKNAERVDVSGNVFENNWTSSQDGSAILITPRNQNGTAPWSVVRDVTFDSNIIRNVGRGFNIIGDDNLQTSQQTERIAITNNILQVTSEYSIAPRYIQLGGGQPINYLTVTNNLFLSDIDGDGPTQAIILNGTGIIADNFVVEDNIWMHGRYQSNITTATAANYSYQNNVIVMMPGGDRYGWNKSKFSEYHPGDSMVDPGLDAVGFVDYANGDYRLNKPSRFQSLRVGEKNPGPNIQQLKLATKGACLQLEGVQNLERK